MCNRLCWHAGKRQIRCITLWRNYVHCKKSYLSKIQICLVISHYNWTGPWRLCLEILVQIQRGWSRSERRSLAECWWISRGPSRRHVLCRAPSLSSSTSPSSTPGSLPLSSLTSPPLAPSPWGIHHNLHQLHHASRAAITAHLSNLCSVCWGIFAPMWRKVTISVCHVQVRMKQACCAAALPLNM